VRSDLNFPVTEVLDQHDISEVADTIVNLDLVLEELLEGGNVEDLVACRLRSVDDELCFSSAPIFPHKHFHLTSMMKTVLGEERRVNTLLVTLACLPLEDFYKIDDLSLLYHAATSQEAGQQQSNFMYILLMVPFCLRKWSQRGEILRRSLIEIDLMSRSLIFGSRNSRVLWECQDFESLMV